MVVLNNKMYNIIGYLLGDGWISVKKNKNNSICYNSGFSGDCEDLVLLKDDLIEIFGDIGKSTISTRKTVSEKYGISGITSMFTCNTLVTKYFISLGLPVGKRVEKEFLLPDFIMNASIKNKAEFISGLYAAEGDVLKMQKNNKTPKCPTFVITKRKTMEDNFNLLLNQIGYILQDIGIKYNIEITNTFTCDYNLKAKFVISNENYNITNFYKTMNIRYCNRKKEQFNLFGQYQNIKIDRLNELEKAFLESKLPCASVTEISKKYNITKRQVQHWRYDNQELGFKLPKTFTTFTEFKNLYCSP